MCGGYIMANKKTAKKTSGEVGKKQSRTRFKLEDQSSSRQRELLDSFAKNLKKFLGSDEQNQETGKKKILKAVQDETDQRLDIRQFDVFLRHLYTGGYLRLGYHALPERAKQLSECKREFNLLEDITVVAGHDPDLFAQAAAESFLKRLFEIGKIKSVEGRSSESPTLNVGIVSGSTTGAVIRAVNNLQWEKDLDLIGNTLPRVRVFALNVCMTVPEHLAGNATILAYQLAEKINEEARDNKRAEAYGLSAQLLIEKKPGQKIIDVDQEPQTFDVVRFSLVS